MKKLLSLLLAAVMLCSMLAVFAVPAAAYTTQEKTVNCTTTGACLRR